MGGLAHKSDRGSEWPKKPKKYKQLLVVFEDILYP